MVGKTPWSSFRDPNKTRRAKEKERLISAKATEGGTLYSELDFTGSDHNDIATIQGGTTNQYYHLTANENAGLSYKLTVNTTQVGNVGAGEDDLITYSLPANTLNANGRGVRITAWGTTANNGDSKTVKLYFGSAILTTALTVSQVSTWRIVAEVFRVSSNNQDYVAQLNQGGATTIVDIEESAITETDSSAITIKCTGTATSNDDIIQKGLLVELIK